MAQRDNVLLANQARMAGCSFSASATAPLGPPSNLLLQEPSAPLIWTDVNDCRVTLTWQTSIEARLVWLGFLSCTDAATWRVRLLLDSVEVYDTRAGVTDLDCVAAGEGAALPHRKNRRHCFLLLDEALEFDEAEITVFDAANPDGRLLLGNLVIDDPFQPAHNISYGLTPPSLFDPSRVPTAVQGQRPALNRTPYDVAEFQLRYGSREEMIGEYRDFIEQTGTTRPVLAILEPQAATFAERMQIFGLLEVAPPLSLWAFRLHSTSFRIEELIP